MIDGFIVIILAMLGCIGLGVLLGWSFWGRDMKYYKCLFEHYKHLCEDYNLIPDYPEE